MDSKSQLGKSHTQLKQVLYNTKRIRQCYTKQPRQQKRDVDVESLQSNLEMQKRQLEMAEEFKTIWHFVLKLGPKPFKYLVLIKHCLMTERPPCCKPMPKAVMKSGVLRSLLKQKTQRN